MGSLVVGSQVVEREIHRECLTLTGLELLCLGKGLQLASGFFKSARGSVDIELDNLLAGSLASIGNSNRGAETILGSFDNGAAIREGRVAQSETEGVGYGLLGGGEVTIAYVDAFYMLGVILELYTIISTCAACCWTYVGEAGAGWEVDEIVGPGHRQLA